jgi:hypothetical protein
MSWSERSVRYHKRQTDCVIRHAYARLATDAPAVAKFHGLLHYARNRAAVCWTGQFSTGITPGSKRSSIYLDSEARISGQRPSVRGPHRAGGWGFRRFCTTLSASTRFRCFSPRRGIRLRMQLRTRSAAGS